MLAFLARLLDFHVQSESGCDNSSIFIANPWSCDAFIFLNFRELWRILPALIGVVRAPFSSRASSDRGCEDTSSQTSQL